MSAAPAEPTPVEDAPAVVATPPEPPTPTEPPKPEEPKANPWDNPTAAKAEIERLRKENGAARTNAKTQAADDARKELAQTIGKALGLVEDEQPIDPAKLTESLTTAQTEAKQARVELAVFRSAPEVGGDPAALLDSTSFLTRLANVDPSDSAAVSEAIRAAVDANPRLGVAKEPRVPAPNPAQGASTGTPSAQDLAAQAAASGNWKQAAALKADQLLAIRQTNPQ